MDNIFDSDYFENAMESTDTNRKEISEWKRYAYDKCHTDGRLKKMTDECWRLCCLCYAQRFNVFHSKDREQMMSDVIALKDKIVDYLYKDKNRPDCVTRKTVDTFVCKNLITHGERYSLY